MNHTDLCDQLAAWLASGASRDPGWPAETWRAAEWVCRVHGVAPLLHRRLAGSAWLPDSFREWLARQYEFNRQRVAKMQQDLQAILAMAAGQGLPLLPLKGSLLAARDYPDPGCRPMADLDVLVQPRDFEKAARGLVSLGYEQRVRHWKHTEFVRPDNRRVVSAEVEHPDNPRRVELHAYCRETFGGPTIDLTERMWNQAAPGRLLGELAWLPAVEILWLHLLVHATYHLWQGRGRLLHLVDLELLWPRLSQPEAILASVDARYTYPALALWGNYFPSAPADLLAQQAGQVSARFRQWAASRNLVNTSCLDPRPQGLYLLKALRFADGRPGEFLQALRFALLPGPEELALDHPRLAQSSAPWLAYLLLPLDWANRLIRKKMP